MVVETIRDESSGRICRSRSQRANCIARGNYWIGGIDHSLTMSGFLMNAGRLIVLTGPQSRRPPARAAD
jgi:hypothetical protein